jgi:hypothetical protein
VITSSWKSWARAAWESFKHRRRFEREAKAAAKLHHTNIVPVFGVGEHDGLPYYVMQCIPGLGLDEVLDELIRLRGGSAKRLARIQRQFQRPCRRVETSAPACLTTVPGVIPSLRSMWLCPKTWIENGRESLVKACGQFKGCDPQVWGKSEKGTNA